MHLCSLAKKIQYIGAYVTVTGPDAAIAAIYLSVSPFFMSQLFYFPETKDLEVKIQKHVKTSKSTTLLEDI